MSEPKFTPGPYRVVERADTFNVLAGRRCLARFQKKAGARADAEAYAALPDLYEALAGIDFGGHVMTSGEVRCPECHWPSPREQKHHAPGCKISAALARARGKTDDL